jgi:hypothetical protein
VSTLRWLGFVMLVAATACTVPNPSFRAGRPATGTSDARALDGAGSGSDVPGAGPDALESISTLDGGRADSSSGDAAAVPRLVGYWRLDEATGATMALDSSGNGNHGRLESFDGADPWVSGHMGNAIRFVAGGSIQAGIRVPLSASVAGVREFTVAAWIYRSSAPLDKNTSVISRQLGTSSWEIYNLSAVNDDLALYVGTDVQPYPRVRVSALARLDEWMHVAATYDGAHLRLYKGGVEVGSLPLTRPLPADDSPLYIGTNKNGSSHDVFVGTIDEVVLYSVALPAAAIRSLQTGADPATL